MEDARKAKLLYICVYSLYIGKNFSVAQSHKVKNMYQSIAAQLFQVCDQKSHEIAQVAQRCGREK